MTKAPQTKRAARKPTPSASKPTPRGRTARAASNTKSTPPPKPTGLTNGERLKYAQSLVRNIPDFPKKGILFKDITPLLADPKGFAIVIDSLTEHFIGDQIDAIVGIESRGFVFGGALAARLNTSFVPVRKPGKLPAAVDRVAYSLEYGKAELEMHKDSLREGAKVLIIDDLLATGGTAAAAAELVRKQGAYVTAFAFVVELTFLDGADKLVPVPVLSLMRFGAGE
ncbi:MAG: adenine phosphoribosyltransferase [Deltaproteobacteria bacterium]|nr:adenine phosphoribosyltransferase [Deltaproteobacteria bacterium]